MQLYSKIQLKADHPIKFVILEENKGPFGHLAYHQSATFSVTPNLIENEKYHIIVRVTFSEFAKIRTAVPFEVVLIPIKCD